jgi:hypothetical protein
MRYNIPMEKNMKLRHPNPRNTGYIGKKRSKAFCEAQSKRLTGKTKSPETKARMQAAAHKRWADPAYRAKHSKIMKERWAQVHKAEKVLKSQKIKD